MRLPFTAFRALRELLVCLDHQSTTDLARFSYRPLPTRPVAVRVVGAAIKDSSFPCVLLDQFTTVIRTGDTDLIKDLFGVATLGKITAANKPTITTLAVNKLIAAPRAISPYRFRFRADFYFRYGFVSHIQSFREASIEAIYYWYPGFAISYLVQFSFQTSRKVNGHNIRKVFHEQIVDKLSDFCGRQPLI